MQKLFVFALLCATAAPAAFAASPWDGNWKLDQAKSHLTGNSFTLSKAPGGMWHMTAGQINIDYAPDGKPYPIFDADHTVTTAMDSSHSITMVNKFRGKTVSIDKETISPDGNTMTDVTAGTYPDGSTYTETDVSKRTGPGEGFFGKWTSTKETASTQGVIEISTAPDGAITWAYPLSKETITGKPDGTPLAVSGPQMVHGVTIAYNTVSPHRLKYKVALNGKEVSEGYDELASDGKTFTEVSWAPGEMAEKTTAVYVKQ